MRFEKPLVPAMAIFVLSGALLACTPNNQGIGTGAGAVAGTGGQGGSGGIAENGGATGSGGVMAFGGTTGTGGTTANGGNSGPGGSSGVGGTTASGGTSGSGGTAGRGGSVGTGGGTVGSGGTAGGGGMAGGGGTAGSAGSAGSGGMPGSGGTAGSGGKGGGSGTAIGGATAGAGGTASGGGTAGNGGAAGGGGTNATGGTTASVACTDTSTTALAFTKQYEDGSIAVTGSTKTYYTLTNWWSVFKGQTVTIDGLSMRIGNSGGAAAAAGSGNPTGFPSIFIGTYQGHATMGSNLPKKVTDIKSVPTIFSTNASSLDTANMNATYDVWFTANGTALGARSSSPGAGGAYLMVWLYKPSNRQPRGGSGAATGAAPNYPGTTVSGVPGTWDVWVDSKTDPPCISYVASSPIDSLSYDLNNFIQDSITNKYGVTASMYLSIVFAGFEIWSGGDGVMAKQFCAAVN